MNQVEMLQTWMHSKQTRNFFRLVEGQPTAFELKAHRVRIVYAFLRFECEPAAELSFYRTASWPGTLSTTYQMKLDQAIVEGIVEGLFTRTLYPYSACKLTCVEVKWHDVDSSEASFYEAAMHAMLDLRANGKWEMVVVENHRGYYGQG